MDMGCSLKGSTASMIAKWDHFHTDIIKDFKKISQIWGHVCGGNGVSVLPYPHPQLFNSLTAIDADERQFLTSFFGDW